MVRDIIYREATPGVSTPEVVSELFGRVPQILASDTHEPPEPARTDAREQAAGMSEAELTDRLVHRFIGDHELLGAQRAALDALAAGRSALCVMATGRGKSLVFHVHAARLALARSRASVFVYPLRALVADQSFHITGELAALGLSARVLTGESSPEVREEVFGGLAAGTVDVVLTTPEFLAIH